MALDLGYDLPQEENTQAASSDIAVKIKTKIQNDYVKADIFFLWMSNQSLKDLACR